MVFLWFSYGFPHLRIQAGFMRMLRGVDESGIESIAEAASVEPARRGPARAAGVDQKPIGNPRKTLGKPEEFWENHRKNIGIVGKP